MLVDDVGPPERRAPSIRASGIVAAAVVALLAGLQFTAAAAGFQGPLYGLLSDYVATPDSVTLPWAGLGLAMVGLTNRRRIAALGWAVGLDVVFALERAVRTGVLTVGNGPLIVLTGLALIAGLRWSGADRYHALHAAGWGALLIVGSKAADTWLQITAMTRPAVWDEYAMVADYALGQPSWLAGRVLEAAGPAPYGVLHWIYIELPVAATIVAVYQLRTVTTDGWPRHHVMRTFVALGLIGSLIYLVFPVVGPVSAFGPEGAGFEIADYWPQIAPPADLAPRPVAFDDVTARNCMPSMHLAWALVVFLHSRTGPGWLRWGGAVWLVGTVLATMGYGYHYGVDLIVGAVLGLVTEAVLRESPRGRESPRVALAVFGVALLTVLLLSYRYLAVQMAQLPLLSGSLLIGALVVLSAAFSVTFRQPSRRSAALGGADLPAPVRGRWVAFPSVLPGRSRHG